MWKIGTDKPIKLFPIKPSWNLLSYATGLTGRFMSHNLCRNFSNYQYWNSHFIYLIDLNEALFRIWFSISFSYACIHIILFISNKISTIPYRMWLVGSIFSWMAHFFYEYLKKFILEPFFSKHCQRSYCYVQSRLR